MKKSEKTIFELFSDLKGITNYMDDYDSLKEFYNLAVGLFNAEKYSHIDMKDDKGNTFLHYAMNAGNFEWSEKILRKGANPFLKNDEGKNCFFMFKSYVDAYSFSERFKDISLDDQFVKKTSGFGSEYKQHLLEALSKKAQFFKNIEEVHSFLNGANLYSLENTSRLLAVSLSISLDKKVSSYMVNYDGEENNTFFFSQLAHSSNDFIFKNKKLEKLFFERKFKDNASFISGVCNIVSVVKDSKSFKPVIENISKLMIEQDFDMNRKTGHKQESIEDFLLSNEFVKPIYLQEKLTQKLVINKCHTKVVKI